MRKGLRVFHGLLRKWQFQKYLYRINNSDVKALKGFLLPTSRNAFSRCEPPRAKYAVHGFSNHYAKYSENDHLQDHQLVEGASKIESNVAKADKSKSRLEFFSDNRWEGVAEMDGWMVAPELRSSFQNIPLYSTCTEPSGGRNVKDQWVSWPNGI